METAESKTPAITVVGHNTVSTVIYNGSILQRHSSTMWYTLNPTENRWEAIANHEEVEVNYQESLRAK